MDSDNLRILVIDDNPAIHQDFLKILIQQDSRSQDDKAELLKLELECFGATTKQSLLPEFEIDTASQGEEGLIKVAQSLKAGKPYALAFVDIHTLPNLDGIETIKHIWELDRTIQIVVCSAHDDYPWEQAIEKIGKTDNLLMLRKPFDTITVRQLTFALTKKWYLSQQALEYTASLEEEVLTRTKSLQHSFSLARATLDSSPEGIIVVDTNQKIIDYNHKFLEIWNLSKIVMLNFIDSEKIMHYISNQMADNIEYLDQLKQTLSNSQEIFEGSIKVKEKHYEYYTKPYTSNGQIIGRLWSFRDVSIRASLEQKLLFQATHDMLTKLPNRALLAEFMKQAMLNADKNNTLFAIFFLDLDGFKLINDTLNHTVGDGVLCGVANRLQQFIRKDDMFARLGGDEFVIISGGLKQPNDIINLAKNIIMAFTKPFLVAEHELSLTTSIGICFYPTDGDSIDILLRNADSAMYQAKDLGANQFQFYTENLNKLNLLQLEQETELRRALQNKEFFLCYQPQYNLSTGRLVSMEALIRWNHPQRGLLQPIDFIPFAEQAGLIVSIDEWVLRTVCNQIKNWQDEGLPLIRIAVNVTTKQFKAYNFPKMVKSIIDSSNIPPQYLEFELSENIMINNPDIIKSIAQLKEIGVQIALDDFGTGYSALSYLRLIPLDRLKIDQSFIQRIGLNAHDDVIIQAIITIAKGLNLEILAEGVETQHQLNFLKNVQCGEVQGFLFNEPLKLDECTQLLKKIHANKSLL